MAATWQRTRVAATVEENHRVRSLALDAPAWPGHNAGQHVDVRLTAEDGYQAQRSYSIASEPEAAQLVLTVERIDDGEVSPYLVEELRVGDELELRGPIGGWFQWQAADGGPLLLVGGGSGIVPLMAMLRHRIAVGSDVPVRLLVSWRSPADAIYADELARAAALPGVEIVQTFTRAAPPGWSGPSRRIDAALLADVAFAPGAARCFVCGPTALVEVVADLLAAQGHADERIRTERFGPSS